MTPSQEKQWREEFKEYANSYVGNDSVDHLVLIETIDEAFDYINDYVGIEGIYLAARKKAQEEIDELRNVELHSAFERIKDLSDHIKTKIDFHSAYAEEVKAEYKRLDKELEKRDKLLSFIAKVCVNDYDECYVDNVERFLKGYEDLEK